jgi:hypothetical protein
MTTTLVSVAGALTPAGALGTSFQTGGPTTVTRIGAITPTGAVTKVRLKALGGGLTPAGALARLPILAVAAGARTTASDRRALVRSGAGPSSREVLTDGRMRW